MHWARQYLVWEGLIDSSRRGIWTLTPAGAKSHLNEEQSRDLVRRLVKLHSKKLRPHPAVTDGDDRGVEHASQMLGDGAEIESPELAEENELLEVLRSLSPEGFERLCKRLLHE